MSVMNLVVNEFVEDKYVRMNLPGIDLVGHEFEDLLVRNGFRWCGFMRMNLCWMDLSGNKFVRMNLSGIDLVGINFSGCICEG